MSTAATESELPFWNDGLDKPVALKGGTELHTLQKAGALSARHFGKRRRVTFDAATLMLEAVAETGDGKAVFEAGRMVELELESEGLK